MILEKKNRIPCLKYTSFDTPHVTIETNRTCNIRCRDCYNLDRNTVKSLDHVRAEIDLACTKRNLETITLLGGEPTIHPDLVQIVSHVKSKGLRCQILSNGIVFLNDRNNHFLGMLNAAGLDRVLLHVDEGQGHIHGDIEEVRRILFEKCEENKIRFSLSITICDENTQTIPLLIRKYSKYEHFDGILSVLYESTVPKMVDANTKRMEREYQSIKNTLHLEPLSYIPSNIDDRHVNWLIYYYFITTRNQELCALSPAFYTLLRKLYRILMRHHLFALVPTQSQILLLFFANSVFRVFKSLNMVPVLIRNIYLLFSNLLQPRFHYIVIQEPPQTYYEANKIRICYSCPDATVRNGHLIPVCIADMVSPLKDRKYANYLTDAMIHTVHDHINK